MRTARTAAALLVLLTGCSDDPVAGSYTFVSEGSGKANAASLAPLAQGMRWIDTATGLQALVTRTEPVSGGTRAYYESERTLTWLDTTVDGLFDAGSTHEGARAAPRLVVPSTVRVGMEWVTRAEDGSDDRRFRVSAREEKATVFGASVVWTIDESLAGGSDPITRTYVEGRGLVGVSGAFRPEGKGVARVFDAAFLPSDPPASAAAHVGAATPLEPMKLGDAQGQWPFEATWITSLDVAGTQYIQVAGAALASYQEDLERGTSRVDTATACLRLDAETLADGPYSSTNLGVEGFSHGDPGCLGGGGDLGPTFGSDATGAILAPDGTIAWMQRTPFGYVNDDDLDFFNYFASYLDADDKPQALFSYYQDGRALSWARTEWQDLSVYPQRVDGDELVGLDALQQLGGDRGIARVVMSPLQGATPTPIAILTRTGLVIHSTFGERLSRPVPALGMTGNPSVRNDGAKRETLIAEYDGDVSELVVDASGARLRHVARLAVPVGQRLVGVLRTSGGSDPAAGDSLLAFTHAGLPVTNGGVEGQSSGTTYAWQASVGVVEDVVAPPVLGVSAEVSGADALVCVPPSAGAFATTGWKLGGAPAAAAVVTGTQSACLLVVRDHLAAPIDAPGAFVVEGVVPGAGPMLIAIPSGRAGYGIPFTPVQHPAAALSSGGLVTGIFEFGPGGVLLGMPDRPSTETALALETAGGTGVADAAGNGLWIGNTLVRREGVLLLDEVVGGPVGAVQGGGGLFGAQTISPSGAGTPVTRANGAPFAASGVLSDGTACGYFYSPTSELSFVCVHGSTEIVAPVPSGVPQGGAWYPLDDASFAVDRGMDGLWRLDATTLAYTELDARPMRAPMFDSHGTLFAVAHPLDGPRSVVRIDSKETTDVPLGLPAGMAIDAVIPEDDVFLVYDESGALVRVPRP